MNTTKLTLNKNIITNDNKLQDITTQVKELNVSKKETIKTILNLVLKDIKELKTLEPYKLISKKQLTQIARIKFNDDGLSNTTKAIVKSVFVYLESKSNLDLKSLSVAKFNLAMKLINNGLQTRFKSNKELETVIKEYNFNQLQLKASRAKANKTQKNV